MPNQTLHFYQGKGHDVMRNAGVERVHMAGGQGAHTPFSEGEIPHYCAFPPQLRVEMSHWNLLYILGKWMPWLLSNSYFSNSTANKQ